MSEVLYRVTWEGCVIPWHVAAMSTSEVRAKVQKLRADRQLPAGLRIVSTDQAPIALTQVRGLLRAA